MAIKEKTEYEDKMREYRILHNIPEKIEKVKKPKVSKPEKPKTPFHYYMKDVEGEFTESNPTLKKKEIYEKIKAQWKELKDEKDDVVIKYKKIAKDKKNELKTSVTISTQTSPQSSPPLSPSRPLSPARSITGALQSASLSPNKEDEPKKKKKKDSDGEPKKKKKKDSDGEPKKKKLIKKKVEEDDEDENDMSFEY
jgi:hypothetical protein